MQKNIWKKRKNNKIPIATIKKKFNKLKSIIENDCEFIALTGSGRRQKSHCGDMDILIYTSKQKSKILKNFNVLEFSINRARIIFDNVPTELIFGNLKNLGFLFLYTTGSREFNGKLIKKAKSKNLKMNRMGIFNISGKNISNYLTENQCLKLLDSKIIAPKER